MLFFVSQQLSVRGNGANLWELIRSTFYTHIPPAMWTESNERLFWTTWGPDMTTEDALVKFHQAVGREATLAYHTAHLRI